LLFSVYRLPVHIRQHNYNVITSSDKSGTTDEHKACDKNTRVLHPITTLGFSLPWSYFSGGYNAETRCALAYCRCTCTSVRQGPSWRCRNCHPNVSLQLSASRSSRSLPPSFVHLRPPQRSLIAIRKVSEARAISPRLRILLSCINAFYSHDCIWSIFLIMCFNHCASRLTGPLN